MAKFVGPTGLVYLWNKIKNYVAKSITDLHLGDTYVAKETGKGLSTNDYTTAEKNKLGGIAAGAEVNVQANWAEGNSSADSYIQNKPTIPSKTSDLTNDSGFITSADIPEGAAASSTTPLMDGTASVGSETTFARGDHRHPSDTNKQDTISDLATIRSGAALGATAIQTETDPVFTASAAHGISSSDISSWNAKGTYSKPSGGIPATDMASEVQTALTAAGNAIPSSQKGTANGVATLDSTGKVPSSQLPSYVDDVVEAYIRNGQTALSSTWLATDSASGTVITPEGGVIYMIMNGNDTYPTNSEYRWGGTAYVPIYDGGASEMTTAEMDTATDNWQ